jgi:hypothetical protein
MVPRFWLETLCFWMVTSVARRVWKVSMQARLPFAVCRMVAAVVAEAEAIAVDATTPPRAAAEADADATTPLRVAAAVDATTRLLAAAATTPLLVATVRTRLLAATVRTRLLAATVRTPLLAAAATTPLLAADATTSLLAAKAAVVDATTPLLAATAAGATKWVAMVRKSTCLRCTKMP